MPPFVVNEMKNLPQKAGKCACALAFRQILRYNLNLFADVFGMRKGDAPCRTGREGTLYGGRLVEIIRILRDRENGCPWDKVQTHASIRKNFLEETCEALEAIDADDPVMMQEELGDVLMQVVFHTVIEEERPFRHGKGLPRGVREAGLPPPEHLCFLGGGKCWYKQLGCAQK